VKKVLLTTLCVIVSLSTPKLHGDNTQITTNDSHKDQYSWTLTDENQKKQAVGMLAWGFLMTIVIAIVANLAPSNPAPTSTTNNTGTSTPTNPSTSGISS
jgi:hypothetical protein